MKFREIRKKAGLVIEEAADRIGLSHSQLSRIERGKTDFTGKTLAAMAEVYGVEVGDLFARERGAMAEGSGDTDQGDASDEAVGRRLKQLRDAFELDANLFCKMVGFDPDRLQACENGVSPIRIEEVLMINQRIGVPGSWIYFGDRSDLSGRLLALLDKPAPADEDVG